MTFVAVDLPGTEMAELACVVHVRQTRHSGLADAPAATYRVNLKANP